MSITSAVIFFEQINEGIEEGRLTDLSDIRIAVNTAISMLNNPEEFANTGDEDQFEILLELESLNEKRAKCEARLAKLQERTRQKQTTNGSATGKGTSSTANIPRATTSPPPINRASAKNTKSNTFIPSTSASASTFLPAPNTSHLRFAIVAFPGGPRTVTIHPPGSPDFQPIVRDKNGDIIIVFESRGQNPLRRQAAFYGFQDAERAAKTEVYGCLGKQQEMEPVCPAPHRSESQSSKQSRPGQPQPSTTAVPTAESEEAETFTDEHPEASSASTSAHVAPAKQTAERLLKRCGARLKLTSPRESTSPSPCLGKEKGKARARDDKDGDGDAKEVDGFLVSQAPTLHQTDRRAEKKFKPSLPLVWRSRAAHVKEKEPSASKPAKRTESSHAAEKPGPAKRRRFR